MVLPVIRATPTFKNPGLVGEVFGVEGPGVRFKDECRGGDGGRVEE